MKTTSGFTMGVLVRRFVIVSAQCCLRDHGARSHREILRGFGNAELALPRDLMLDCADSEVGTLAAGVEER